MLLLAWNGQGDVGASELYGSELQILTAAEASSAVAVRTEDR